MMDEGGPMVFHSIKNKLGADAFNTPYISSKPFWEHWMSMDQRALPQSVEWGSLVSVYNLSKCMFNDFMPAPPTSPLGYFTDLYHVATFAATSSIFQMPFPQRAYQLGIPSPPLIAPKEDRQKRKRCLNGNSAGKSLRRDSSRGSKANTTTGGRGTGRSNRPCDTDDHHSNEHSDQQG